DGNEQSPPDLLADDIDLKRHTHRQSDAIIECETRAESTLVGVAAGSDLRQPSFDGAIWPRVIGHERALPNAKPRHIPLVDGRGHAHPPRVTEQQQGSARRGEIARVDVALEHGAVD